MLVSDTLRQSGNLRNHKFRLDGFFFGGQYPGMKLADWLHQERLTQLEFARRMEVAPARISDWVNGKAIPSLPSALAISRATGGAVKPEDLVPAEDSAA